MRPPIDLARTRLIDLAQEYRPGMPHWPTHPPFAFTLTKRHGEQITGEGVSSAADLVAMGTHNGTHIDALCHFSRHGLLCGGLEAAPRQSYTGGLEAHGAETIAPILRRGVLADFAAAGPLPPQYEITAAELEAAAADAQPGDVVLIRTGWASYWPDPVRYLNGQCHPGPGLAAARWLSARGVFAAGSDTVAFERIPSPGMPVHAHLLVEKGIHIIENLNLEELARSGARDFVFAGAPLKIRGATGAPLRAFALVEAEQ
mgnify:CR=1 FL=1